MAPCMLMISGRVICCRSPLWNERRHRADEINRTIGALNSMFGGQGAGNDYGSLDYKLCGASGVQQEALDFVSKAVSAMGSPPEGLTCSEALRQLRATSGYVEDQATGALAPYVPGNVSLPEEGWRPISLDALWGQDGRESVGSHVQQQLLPADEVETSKNLRLFTNMSLLVRDSEILVAFRRKSMEEKLASSAGRSRRLVGHMTFISLARFLWEMKIVTPELRFCGAVMVIHHGISLVMPSEVQSEKRGRSRARSSRPAPTASKTELDWETVKSSTVRRSQVKRKRQASRAGASSATPEMTVLEEASVSKGTRDRYAKIWTVLKPMVTGRTGRLLPRLKVEQMLCGHLKDMYMDGEDVASAQYTVAALMFHNPSLRSKGMTSLPRVKQSLTGWKRLAPEKSRLPIPFEALALIFMFLVQSGRCEIGLFLLVSFMLYLRPSEGLRLRTQDVVRPSRKRGAFSFWTFILHPQEMQIPSKTREFDESLQLDLDYHNEVGNALARVLKFTAKQPEEKIFKFGLEEANQALEDAATAVGLQKLGSIHLYRLRHGGASHDFVHKLRDLASIQLRGRWKSMASVRRYQKGARLAQLFNSLDSAVQTECLDAAKLGKVIARQNNWPVLLWNIQYGTAYDLKLIVNQWKILGWIRVHHRCVLTSSHSDSQILDFAMPAKFVQATCS
ncbi:unnamed protein product [Symbiodinium sp. CCMP2456]|nr:unnamed protein product [Symbiodinium sp. CCMP2456]